MQKIRKDAILGHNIRSMRVEARLTQEQVVTRMQLAGCDISRSIYSQMEGGTYNIRATELAALREIFGVDYNAFFEGIETPGNGSSETK